MPLSAKTNSKRVGKRKRNRGGERLSEWRLLRHTKDYRDRHIAAALRTPAVVEPAPLSPLTTPINGPPTYLTTPITETPSPFRTPIMPDPIPMEVLEELPFESANYTSEPLNNKLTGRRIVSINFFFKEIRRLSDHSPFDCHFVNMIFKGEVQVGLKSGFKFTCAMCNKSDILWSEDSDGSCMDINTASVAGIMPVGSGYSGLQELLGAKDVRCMSQTTYDRYHFKVAEGWQKAAVEEMREAAAEEANLARVYGEVDRDGVPLLAVVADASWAKRSYRCNYNSSSGVAAIVGYRTKKVLYIGVKNKFCTACSVSEKKKKIENPMPAIGTGVIHPVVWNPQ